MEAGQAPSVCSIAHQAALIKHYKDKNIKNGKWQLQSSKLQVWRSSEHKALRNAAPFGEQAPVWLQIPGREDYWFTLRAEVGQELGQLSKPKMQAVVKGFECALWGPDPLSRWWASLQRK